MNQKESTLYNKVYSDIIDKIKKGEYKVGDKLPTEMELTQIYGVSRITVSRAMKELADLNLIYRIKHSGTFVNGKIARGAPLIIPVILPYDENFTEIIDAIRDAAISNNTFIPFYNSKNNITRERDCLQEILKTKFDGLIVYPCNSLNNIDLYAEILSKDIPIVCIDRSIEGLKTPLVTTNNVESMRNLVNTLAERGHKKIGFLAICEQMAVTETDRFRGFCQGVIDNKLRLKREYIYNIHDIRKKELRTTQKQQQKLLIEYVEKEFDKYLSEKDKPTAICCLNDSLAETLYAIAVKNNIKIPQDLTLTSFDCKKGERATKLLSINQNFYSIGATAITLMFNILNGKPYHSIEKVSGLLVTP